MIDVNLFSSDFKVVSHRCEKTDKKDNYGDGNYYFIYKCKFGWNFKAGNVGCLIEFCPFCGIKLENK